MSKKFFRQETVPASYIALLEEVKKSIHLMVGGLIHQIEGSQEDMVRLSRQFGWLDVWKANNSTFSLGLNPKERYYCKIRRMPPQAIDLFFKGFIEKNQEALMSGSPIEVIVVTDFLKTVEKEAQAFNLSVSFIYSFERPGGGSVHATVVEFTLDA